MASSHADHGSQTRATKTNRAVMDRSQRLARARPPPAMVAAITPRAVAAARTAVRSGAVMVEVAGPGPAGTTLTGKPPAPVAPPTDRRPRLGSGLRISPGKGRGPPPPGTTGRRPPLPPPL